jgi:putative hydrolase of the HAD superfamily
VARTSLPEVVFFDVGDTLIRAHPSWAGVYRESLLEFGIDISEKDMERALLEETRGGAWWLNEQPFEPTEESSYERIKRFDLAVLARVGHPELDEEAIRLIESAFSKRSAWYVFPDVIPALAVLRDAAVRMGVISNFVWGGPELIHDLELAQYFDALTVSARVGFQKPHQGIFEHALNALQVEPQHAMHVGDSYNADVAGARRMGIEPVLIDRVGADPARVRDENDDPDLPIVADLNELLDMLGLDRPTPAPQPATTAA